MAVSELAKRHNPVADGNWHRGRSWVDNKRGRIDCIVDHVTEGSRASVRQWFNDPAASVSATYMVPTSGPAESFVDENDTAYHAGQLVEPSSALVIARYALGKYTPNSYAVGIEHEGDGNHELTDEQRATSTELHADICRRLGVLCDRVHIFGHHEVKKSKTCPGAISVDRIVAGTAELLAGPVAVTIKPADLPARPELVWSPTLGAIVPVDVSSDAVWTFAKLDELLAAIRAGVRVKTYRAGAPLSVFKPYTRPT